MWCKTAITYVTEIQISLWTFCSYVLSVEGEICPQYVGSDKYCKYPNLLRYVLFGRVSNATYSPASCKPLESYSSASDSIVLSVSHTVVGCNLITVRREVGYGPWQFTHGILGGSARLRWTMKLPLTFIHLTLSLSICYSPNLVSAIAFNPVPFYISVYIWWCQSSPRNLISQCVFHSGNGSGKIWQDGSRWQTHECKRRRMPWALRQGKKREEKQVTSYNLKAYCIFTGAKRQWLSWVSTAHFERHFPCKDW